MSTDYTYYGIGNVEVTQNDDGSVDYTIHIRDDQKFSDGEPMTIDDYIFSFYVLADPTYDGSSTIYALPIEGMEEYRSGMQSKLDLILGTERAGYEANDYYTEDEYDAFWTAFDAAGENFAQEIVDYCIARATTQKAIPWQHARQTGAMSWRKMLPRQDFFDADRGRLRL